jgi:uncharacterized hydrophobic protein (TIGR00271 family)
LINREVSVPQANYTLLRKVLEFRSGLSSALGVEADRKESLYLELSRGATLYDLVYWLQIFFSAGIATLGLVLNSPAVIIGAMLISPLMGPILASGLALASGDIILGIRALSKLFLSCALAIGFAVILVAILPFKEMTNEIAVRTQPNTLDLIIALFSGAVGSIAVCRDVKGVATSIPGVAIAVALMPPLCVAGYGLGLIFSLDMATGGRIAWGGGLLFLTNLVAITFTAMIVFLLVRLSTSMVKDRMEEWEHSDPESAAIMGFINRFPRLANAREIRSLGVRFAMILIPLLAILVPLTQSFIQLQEEIAQERRDNALKKEIRSLWQDRFQKRSDGKERSSLDQLTVVEKDNLLNVDLRVFDEEPYTSAEKTEYVKLLASRLNRSPQSINLRVTEIPTSSVLAALRSRPEAKTPTLGELQANLWNQIDGAIREIQLPSDAKLISRQVITDGANSLHLKMRYLCESAIDPVVQDSVVNKVRSNLGDNKATVSLERIPTDLGFLEFPRGSASLPILGMLELDFVGRVMRENPILALVVSGVRHQNEAEETATARLQYIKEYLESRWQIPGERIELSDKDSIGLRTKIAFRASDGEKADPKEIQ